MHWARHRNSGGMEEPSPSWYVISSEDRVVAPTFEAAMTKRMNATTIALQSGHLAMINHAAEVSAFIEKAASSLQP